MSLSHVSANTRSVMIQSRCELYAYGLSGAIVWVEALNRLRGGMAREKGQEGRFEILSNEFSFTRLWFGIKAAPPPPAPQTSQTEHNQTHFLVRCSPFFSIQLKHS